MKRTIQALLALMICALLPASSWAQRGVGQTSGVAQQAISPEVVVLTGKVMHVETGPCETTTGHSLLGTHFLMEDAEGATLNIHLGPAGAVEFVAKELAKDQDVEVKAFRTELMKQDHYVARSVTIGDQTVTIRDESLRPVWTGRSAAQAADSPERSVDDLQRGPGRARGAGYGRGRGQGWGRGRGGGGYRAATGHCPRFGATSDPASADSQSTRPPAPKAEPTPAGGSRSNPS